ncbi:MAG: TldD/PmbA family protein [SAR324 cluster bacterium]|nr:TldD/PmbA family protein [SAR324 cluster bacterium]
MTNDFDIQKCLAGIDLNAEWIGLREVKETGTHHFIRDGHPEGNSKISSHGVMVEVLTNGQFGYYGTHRLDQESVRKAAEMAFQQAREASKWAIHAFTEKTRPRANGNYHSPFKSPKDAISPGELNHLLVKMCQALKVSDKIISTHAYARLVESEFRFVSSNGSNVFQKFLLLASDYTATAQEGNLIQHRSDGGSLCRCYQIGMEFFEEEKLLQRAENIGAQAVELLYAEECPSEKTTLVLAPDQMILQIHESVGHPLELDRLLGDERNYAGWTFVKPEDFGHLQYGSELMNITFDPTKEGEYASYAFDDSGMKAEREFLIKEGKLVRGLGGTESQARLKIPGVANFRSSSWNRAPIDRMANLNLEPGQSTREELIGSVEKGIFMESNRSWSIDDYRNKFQFGCEYAKRIENGKLTNTLRNPNYRGISTPFWNNLKKIGDSSTVELYGSPYCGKGEPNQAIRVGHASPLCLFEEIEVFGGTA